MGEPDPLAALLADLWDTAWSEGEEYGTQGRVRASSREAEIARVVEAVREAVGAEVADEGGGE